MACLSWWPVCAGGLSVLVPCLCWWPVYAGSRQSHLQCVGGISNYCTHVNSSNLDLHLLNNVVMLMAWTPEEVPDEKLNIFSKTSAPGLERPHLLQNYHKILHLGSECSNVFGKKSWFAIIGVAPNWHATQQYQCIQSTRSTITTIMVSEVGPIKACGQKRSLTKSVLIVSLVYLTLDQPRYVCARAWLSEGEAFMSITQRISFCAPLGWLTHVTSRPIF